MPVDGHEPTETQQAPSRWLVPTLTLASTVNILSARALPVFLPLVAADLGTSVAVLGQVPSLMLLLAGLLALVAGPLADQYSYRATLVVGLLTVVVSAVATGLAPTFPLLLAVTLVGAVARAAVMPTAQAVVATRFTEEGARRRAINWVTAGLTAAVIIGVPLLTTVAAVSSWRVSFFALGSVTLLITVPLWWIVGEAGPRSAGALHLKAVLAAYGPIRRHPPTLIVTAAALASNVGIHCSMTYMTAFLIEQHVFDIQAVGWVFLAIGVTGLAGIIGTGGALGARPRTLLLGSRALTGLLLGAAFALPLPGPASAGLLAVSGLVLGAGEVATALVLTA